MVEEIKKDMKRAGVNIDDKVVEEWVRRRSLNPEDDSKVSDEYKNESLGYYIPDSSKIPEPYWDVSNLDPDRERNPLTDVMEQVRLIRKKEGPPKEHQEKDTPEYKEKMIDKARKLLTW